MKKGEKYIILLESATDSCSVALCDFEHLIAEKYALIPKGHDSMLAPLVKDILDENKLTPKDCYAVAISQGPGSYVGLRIATSLAKGLAFGGGLKLIGISTLTVITQCAIENNLIKNGERLIVPMIDAGRMEVYTANYNSDGEQTSEVSSKILDENSYYSELKENKVLFTGNGALKYYQFLKEKGAENKEIAELLNNATFIQQLPHASGLRIPAIQSLINGKEDSVAYFEPFYLKDFIPGKAKKLL